MSAGTTRETTATFGPPLETNAQVPLYMALQHGSKANQPHNEYLLCYVIYSMVTCILPRQLEVVSTD